MTGLDDVLKHLTKEAIEKSTGMEVWGCSQHGSYLAEPAPPTSRDYAPTCPNCSVSQGNGTTASDMSLYIDLDPTHNLKNPQQVLNPYGV